MQFLQIKYNVAIPIAAALLMAFSPSAWAHAKLQKSVPAADAVLKEAPKNLRLEFNEKLEKTFSSITVSIVEGQTIAIEKTLFDMPDPRVMTLALPALATGRYQVKWKAVTVDGHRVKGSYMFSLVK